MRDKESAEFYGLDDGRYSPSVTRFLNANTDPEALEQRAVDCEQLSPSEINRDSMGRTHFGSMWQVASKEVAGHEVVVANMPRHLISPESDDSDSQQAMYIMTSQTYVYLNEFDSDGLISSHIFHIQGDDVFRSGVLLRRGDKTYATDLTRAAHGSEIVCLQLLLEDDNHTDWWVRDLVMLTDKDKKILAGKKDKQARKLGFLARVRAIRGAV